MNNSKQVGNKIKFNNIQFRCDHSRLEGSSTKVHRFCLQPQRITQLNSAHQQIQRISVRVASCVSTAISESKADKAT